MMRLLLNLLMWKLLLFQYFIAPARKIIIVQQHWLIGFLLSYQPKFYIPDSAINLLVKFMGILISVAGHFSPFVAQVSPNHLRPCLHHLVPNSHLQNMWCIKSVQNCMNTITVLLKLAHKLSAHLFSFLTIVNVQDVEHVIPSYLRASDKSFLYHFKIYQLFFLSIIL